MKKRFIIGSLLGALGLSIFGFNTGFAFSLFGDNKVEEPLKRVAFTSGGDMQGSTHDMSVKLLKPRELKALISGVEAPTPSTGAAANATPGESANPTAGAPTEEERRVLVSFEDAAWHHHCIAVREYLVPVSLLEDIKTIFNDNKLARCEKASNSHLMVLDAATSSYSFDFEKRKISFSSTQDLPKGTYPALREIRQCVEKACAKGQRLPGLVLVPDKDGEAPLRNAVVKGQVGIKVVGYQGRTLSISIGNGLEQEQKVSLEAKLFLKDSGTSVSEMQNAKGEATKPVKFQLVAEDLTTESTELSQYYNYDYYWTLDKRLAAGQYSLMLGGYTTEFEIK